MLRVSLWASVKRVTSVDIGNNVRAEPPSVCFVAMAS